MSSVISLKVRVASATLLRHEEFELVLLGAALNDG